MPCMNGGSCFGSAYTYLCICPTYYTGVLCEKRLGIKKNLYVFPKLPFFSVYQVFAKKIHVVIEVYVLIKV